eukprot:6188252-Pleurochrysis_carterae.AAC.1
MPSDEQAALVLAARLPGSERATALAVPRACTHALPYSSAPSNAILLHSAIKRTCMHRDQIVLLYQICTSITATQLKHLGLTDRKIS